jgi:hypothetical protein
MRSETGRARSGSTLISRHGGSFAIFFPLGPWEFSRQIQADHPGATVILIQPL